MCLTCTRSWVQSPAPPLKNKQINLVILPHKKLKKPEKDGSLQRSRGLCNVLPLVPCSPPPAHSSAKTSWRLRPSTDSRPQSHTQLPGCESTPPERGVCGRCPARSVPTHRLLCAGPWAKGPRDTSVPGPPHCPLSLSDRGPCGAAARTRLDTGRGGVLKVLAVV